MTSEGPSKRSLQGSYRVAKRSASNALAEAEKALKVKKDHNLAKIDSYLNEAKQDLDSMKDVCNELLDYVETENKTDEAVQVEEDKLYTEFDSMYAVYRDFKAQYLTLLKEESDKRARTDRPAPSERHSIGLSSTFVDTNTVKLPRVELRKFNGNRKEFHDWSGLFENIIVNDDRFDMLQKLYYLKNLLEGEAAKLVQNVPYEASAFEPTWKAVKEFFGNKRSLIAQHFAEIMDVPPIKNEEDIRSALCTITAAMRGLEVHGINAKAMSPMITFVIVRKFSITIRREWEKSNTDTSNYPEFSTLELFLKNIAFAFEGARTVERETPTPAKPNNSNNTKRSGTIAALTDNTAAKPSKPAANKSSSKQKPTLKCSLCSNPHLVALCSQFLAQPVAERWKTVKKLNLCENCLKPNHAAEECRYTNCKKCDQRHNSTLHQDEVVDAPPKQDVKTVAIVSTSQPSIVLPSAVAYVIHGWRKLPVRILIDDCAQLTVVSEDFVRRNRISTVKAQSEIGGAVPGCYVSKFAANLQLRAIHGDFQVDIQAKLSPPLQYRVDLEAMEIIKKTCPEIRFEDSVKVDHQTIDLIIGSDYLHKITQNERKVVGTLILQKSHFGWVASGAVNIESSTKAFNHCILDVANNLQKFFEVEEVNGPSSSLSEAEEIETHFLRSARYLSNHKLSVGQPFKRAKSDVADTFRMAVAALIRMEKTLSSEEKQWYNSFMREYYEMDHMERIPPQEIKNSPRSYLPHHAVIRLASLTTVLRAVFNASAKNKTGCSLNETLMVGPSIQPDLFTLLLRFRQYPVAVSADISKMYRCIEIHPEDRDMQRIVYRFNEDEPIQHFRLKTVTYGTSSAPFLATRCLQKVADDNAEKFPIAAESIRSEFYMDDWLSGGYTVEEAVQKQKEVHQLLAESHFPLVKYSSNSKSLLSTIDNDLVGALKAVEFNCEEIISLLGLKWIQDRDTIGVKINFELQTWSKFTKRSTLSLVSRVFDPLGILSPVTITGKILIQSIWKEEIGWDEVIPDRIQAKVESYVKSLHSLQSFELKRSYHADYLECERQLIGFSDASENAYSAVIYLRLVHHGVTQSILVCSKTKVAPIKALTIPRLELCGAVLLTQLATRVRKILKIPAENVFCFSDSTIALAWIRGPAENFQVFVRNRSNFINSLIPTSQWYHVSGDQNPADLCTRGVSTEKFLQIAVFWNHGPEWLTANFSEFQRNDASSVESLPELRKLAPVIAVTYFNPSYFGRWSSFQKLVRMSAYHLRFFKRTHLKMEPLSAVLTKEDIDEATLRIVQSTQRFYFSKEYAALRKNEKLPARSSLLPLNAFLHTDDVIRVGGRLENSSFSFDQKHPIILPRRCEIAPLIVRDLHLQYYHANLSLLLNFVRSKWWIIGGSKKLVKSVVRQCVVCTRLGAQVRTQIMADLPAARVQVSRPFAHTGVDYAGPLSIKCTNHRSTKVNKAYLVIFVCFVTKAVHLEVASELTTEAFVFTFDRFISRRGVPLAMYSDNATNFVGFSNIVSHEQLVNYATKNNFSWKFIPARSPHVGGLWEAAIKSAKAVLLKAVGNQTLNLEQLYTIVAKVESILNSRPLCRDPTTDVGYLTPGHFLVGNNLCDLPASEAFVISLPKRFRNLRQIIDSFWLVWKRDYLHQLQLRSKWQKAQPNFQVGDVVILRSTDSPVLEWPIGRITQIFPGTDGAVRSVELQCRSKFLKRSVHNLIPLPVNEPN